MEAFGASYGCRQAGYWCWGVDFDVNFEWRYLVDRTMDFGRSFDTSLWFIGIRGDTDDKSSRWRPLGSRIGVDTIDLSSKGRQIP